MFKWVSFSPSFLPSRRPTACDAESRDKRLSIYRGRCYVASLLSQFGDVEEVQNRWVPDSKVKSRATFGGMIVKYETRQMAKDAVKGLSLCSRHIQSILLTEVLNYLAEAEIQHPEFTKGATHMIVRGKRAMKNRDILDLKDLLYSMGKMKNMQLRINMQQPGIICEAWFAYASQAYIASIILNESFFGLVPLQVTVKIKSKELDILMAVKMNLMEYVERNRLP